MDFIELTHPASDYIIDTIKITTDNSFIIDVTKRVHIRGCEQNYFYMTFYFQTDADSRYLCFDNFVSRLLYNLESVEVSDENNRETKDLSQDEYSRTVYDLVYELESNLTESKRATLINLLQ